MNCPKCHGPLQFVSLPESVDIESCPYCNGVFYDLTDLTIDLKVENLMASRFVCPKCGGAMKAGTLYQGKLTVEQCGACQGIWLDVGEVQKLRKLSGKDKIVGKRGAPDVDAPPAPKPASAEPSPAQRWPSLAPAAAAPLAAFADQIGARPKPGKERAGKQAVARAYEPPDCGDWNNPDISRNPRIAHDGRSHLHFQTSRPMVSYVLGEFNWKVAVGDLAAARDFVCPPYIISEDRTEEDTTWSLGEYMEPREIWEAFRMEGDPPPKVGVAPAQPNPHEDSYNSVSGGFWIMAAASLGIFVLAAMFCQNKKIQDFSLRYDVTDTEKSRVTFPFDITGRTSNVRVRINTDIDNRWAYFSMALINTRTDEALDFGREVGYYYGVEDGESWSEGSRRDTVYLPSVRPGNYYLRVEPETDASGINYNIDLTRDVPRVSYMFYAWILLSLPFLWVWWRRRSFEVSRWAESDHPWVTEEDDDDD
ncbi:MAG: zf-TFIIB domain-containing protein [Elusimicrobia bacterium]|nr:zf-TFIIB domain-containing protein [Elusimicrobiota bacterium]